jgi:hypothetical protein
MLGKRPENWVEEMVTISGLLAVQCIMGFYMVFVNHVLVLGVNALFLVALTGSTSAVVLLPFAVALERCVFGPLLVNLENILLRIVLNNLRLCIHAGKNGMSR